MRVVVTGATGNVGVALLRALGGDPEVESVLGIARRRPSIDLAKTKWRAADVVTDDLVELFEGADAVVHLAWLIQPSRDEDVLHAVNVDGSRRVFDAAAAAGVGSIVYASSVGTYSEGPKDSAVDESWPTDGISTSFYSRHKAEVERLLDRFEATHPDLRVVRLRPGLIFQREAASGIRRLFLGPFFPNRLLQKRLIPVVPELDRLRFQAVHSDDVAEAYRLALHSEAAGAFNVAADPVLDSDLLASLFDARPIRLPAGLLRGAAAITWRLRLQPSPEGWVDIALGVPVMDTTRARDELGWSARRSSSEALMDLVDGIHAGAGYPTPPLDRGTSGTLRRRELRTGVGASA